MHLKTKAHMVKSSPLLLLLLCHMLELVHVRHWHGLKACWLYITGGQLMTSVMEVEDPFQGVVFYGLWR